MSFDALHEELDPLLPIDFFSLSLQIPKKKSVESSKLFFKAPPLCDLTPYLSEEKFAEVYLIWNEGGIGGRVEFDKPFENSSFPHYHEGDSVEIFIDTRDMKQAGWATRFCHHFVFLGQKVNEVQAQEVTRFRSEDVHPLCDSSLLIVAANYGRNTFSMDFFIPQESLFGFDPTTFPRIGFTYKINRHKGLAQHFSVSSNYFDIMQHPALWSSVRLVEQ